MGLDMYLTKEIYIGANYEHNNVRGKIELTTGPDNAPVKVDVSRVSEITEHVGYWRKANAIHNWFVQNVQDGVDECQKSWVSYEQLQELKCGCETVLLILDSSDPISIEEDYKKWDPCILENIDMQPTEGFFFGGTAIDSWFYQGMEDTIKIIESLDKDGVYYYQTSW